ncbi:uncharacterized protein LOC128034656 isoform X1 [Gossypium raimondii]|uniref:uncharacterized protein LOC128034656 isoform X1 n=1 Tax=Gossypium raimondii TaxID=29730 RepID=UPI00227B35DE|nr:uncharacterized protein LOC128034656 isoform X1 [Gossypium raimondii]
MLPNQPILLTAFGDGDSEDTIRCTLIHQVINQLPIPGNQGSFQILMQSPFPTRHNIPSLTTSRTLQRLLQVNEGTFPLRRVIALAFCLEFDSVWEASTTSLSTTVSRDVLGLGCYCGGCKGLGWYDGLYRGLAL